MMILTVAPISKGIFRESLSYFTTKDVKPGALVIVPVRKKTVPAMVISATEIKEMKSKLRKSKFSLKPIKSIKADSFLNPEFIEACKEIADYFISPIGLVIKDLIPRAILENNFNHVGFRIATGYEKAETKRHETIIFQAPKKERLQYYKSIAREEFAKNRSLFLCLPTTAEADEFYLELKKGIEKYTLILHSKISNKKIKEIWANALKEKHPLLIIATKSFLSLPRKDISTIIIDGESSPFYKLQSRPYLDIRKVAEILSSKIKVKLILGDSVIRTEAYYKFKPEATSRILSEAEQIIVDMNQQPRKWQKAKDIPLISQEVQKMIEEAHEKNEMVILFINRKGYGTTTVCNDCLRTILCEKCDSPLVLHKHNNKTAKFICHKCLKEIIASDQCPYCRSWRLDTFGIGIQRITEEIHGFFPKFKLFRMDSDIVKNQKQGDEIAKNFLSTPGGILIGTEIIFSYINQPIERIGIISVDALFTLPDFRINEKIFQILLKLRTLAKKTFLIQTRLHEQNLFNDVIRGNISGFYRNELETRKQFQYPPFKMLIKITKESKNNAALQKELRTLEKKLEKWNPLSYPAFIPKIKNTYAWHILLKIDPQTWPPHQNKHGAGQAPEQKELYEILSSLSPAWKINVDPESSL